MAVSISRLGPAMSDCSGKDHGDGRWGVFVLEDAETLRLKKIGGAGRSVALGDRWRREIGSAGRRRLLDLTDSQLGLGPQCLFLLPTHEPLDAATPLSNTRGRGLPQVEVGPLPASLPPPCPVARSPVP